MAGPGMVTQTGPGGTPQQLGRGGSATWGGDRAARLRKLRKQAGISRAELQGNPKLNKLAGVLGLRGKGDSHQRDYADVQALINKIKNSPLNGPFDKQGHGGVGNAKKNRGSVVGKPDLTASDLAGIKVPRGNGPFNVQGRHGHVRHNKRYRKHHRNGGAAGGGGAGASGGSY